MDTSELMNIGEIAQKCHISTDRLRYYDKKGLLKPTQIDEDNGYRLYSKEQIFYIDAIKELREQDFSLKEIKEIFNKGNIDLIKKVYSSKEIEIEKEIKRLSSIKQKITHRLKNFEDINTVTKKSSFKEKINIVIKELPARPILFFNSNEVVNAELFTLTHNNMNKVIKKYKLNCASPCMVIYYDDYEICTENKTEIDPGKVIILNESQQDSNQLPKNYTKEIPKGLYITITFRGGRDASLKNYITLKGWIKSNNYLIKGPLIKIYHVHSFHTKHIDDFVSEFQFHVIKPKN